MFTIKGKYTEAKVFADTLEDSAREQIQRLCQQSFVKDCCIRIMPDVHAGAGCVIGFTADLGEKVIPNIVGVDIGCGMLTVEIGKQPIDFAKLDDIIHRFVPAGKCVHEGRKERLPSLQSLHCYRSLKKTKHIEKSIGTLGGGNHFIEVDVDEAGNQYLVIHTGSRNLGKQVAEIYQNLAYDILRGKDTLLEEKKKVIETYKAQGRKKEIQPTILALEKAFQAKEIDLPKELCYLTGEYRKMYLEDMTYCQAYATKNRREIANIILGHLFEKELTDFPHFETIHNYIDHENNMVRKGAVSAKKDEILLIPINMRDGSLICKGKGNPDWNYSAPHGAGRIYSRTTAKKELSVEEFQKEMEGIYTTTADSTTLDESPMAYKSMEEIVKHIEPTIEIIKQIRPVYNFKAGE